MPLPTDPELLAVLGVASLVVLYLLYRVTRSILGRLRRLFSRGGSSTSTDRKYADPDAQRAHEQALERPLEEAIPVGNEYTTVVLEELPGNELRVKINGVNVFVDSNVPAAVSEGDTIRVKITHHSGKGNAAHARVLD